VEWYKKAIQAANRIDPAHTSPWKLASAYALLSIAESLVHQHQPAHGQLKPARGEQTISAPNGEILTLAEVAEMTRQKPSTLRWWRAMGEGVNRPGFHAPSGFCEPAGWSVTCWE
jgi:hypothetical protein